MLFLSNIYKLCFCVYRCFLYDVWIYCCFGYFCLFGFVFFYYYGNLKWNGLMFNVLMDCL